jgi:hypothetical protein
VKPLHIHRLVQKLVCPGADLALRRARIAADKERWNFERTAEPAAEPFDGVDSGVVREDVPYLNGKKCVPRKPGRESFAGSGCQARWLVEGECFHSLTGPH